MPVPGTYRPGVMASVPESNAGLLRPRRAFKRRLAAAIMLAAVFFLLAHEMAHGAPEGRAPDLELRADNVKQARALYKGVLLMPAIADFFEFYERGLTGGRKRISLGPWAGGVLREDRPGARSLTGGDQASGAEYKVVFSQADAATVELLLAFKAPARPSNLSFNIVKLAPDFFKGGSLEAAPAALSDAKEAPVEPRPLSRRMLLSGKGRVIIRGALCDAEVVEMSGGSSMYAMDGRNTPWDGKRSIVIGAEYPDLSPGKRYSFKYSIRCLPPSRERDIGGDIARKAGAASIRAEEFNTWPFFNVRPKEEHPKAGSCRLRQGDHIYGPASGAAETILAREISKLTSLDIEVKPPGAGETGKGIVIERTRLKDLPPEGFEITATPEKVVVRGADERGCLYGVYALLGRITQRSGAWEVPCGVIRDWPDLGLRGATLEILTPAVRDIGIMKRYLDALSRARANTVIFLHLPQQVRAWNRNAADGGWSREDMAEAAGYARSLHMDVWAGMTSGFDPAVFPEMEIGKGATLYDPSNEKNYRYLFSLYEEILRTYRPSTMLIAHDEIQGLLSYAGRAGKTVAGVFAMDVVRIHEWLNGKNVRTAMWGDMLLDHGRWEAEVGAANSQNPFFRSGATHEALGQIPGDVIILDWHYDEKARYSSLGHFRRSGFKTAGVSWHDPKAARNMAGSAVHFGAQGIISTDWGLWGTMSPAATTLYAPLCGWSVKCNYIDDGDNDVAALAETLRGPAYEIGRLDQVPVRLEAPGRRAAKVVADGAGGGVFGLGQAIGLGTLPPGRQVLGGIAFYLPPDDGWVNHVAVSNSGSHGGPEKATVFKGDALAQRIAFLHTGFVEEPDMRARRLGRYLVEYEDGSSETIDLIDNWNITDIRSSIGLRHNDWTFFRGPDLLAGSRPVRFGGPSGIPLNLQVFIWDNPRPALKVRRITLTAADTSENVRLALIGLTFLQDRQPGRR